MKNVLKKKKGRYTQNLRLIGSIIAILFWWYDAYVDTYIFLDGELIDNMLRPEAKDIWMRFTVMASLIGLSFYSHKLITRVKTAEALKDHFVSTVSHELRTPLTSIIGSLDIIKSGMAGEVSEESKKIIGIAHRNSNRLLDLINDILDLQKLEAGLMTYRIEPMPVASFVEEVIGSLAGFAGQYGVTIRAENNAPDLLVQGDKERLTQVLTNLCANAVRYSPSGNEVIINVSQSGTLVRIAVIDHGPGVPQEFKSRIFSQFAQAESGDLYGKGGTGLGLSISKQIIERHEGKISFVSDPGVSTSFYFDLPEFAGTLPARTPAGVKDFDKVTGLFNKRYFEKEFKNELSRAERSEVSLALILVEVEGFDSYCLEYGDDVGEQYLKETADSLSALVKRPGDLMARHSKETFAALLPDTDEKGVVGVMEKMRSVAGRANTDSDISVKINIGGYSIIPERATKVEAVFESAKAALSEAKRG
ncbi:MAG: diguanylate cyclase [Proteobacteria bacterium]|nr:diguanylate cyclase [Pseudomonadota bacterium]